MRTTRSSGKSGFPGGRRLAAALAISALAGAGLTACDENTENPSSTRSKAAPQTKAATRTAGAVKIVWGECPQPAKGTSRDSRLACGTLKVPLDYRNPAGAKIDVAVSRLATATPGKRHGVLLLNPGGPALGGLDMPATMAPTLPKSVLDSYDLIGFDPRGVEHSTPRAAASKTLASPDSSPTPPRTARSPRTSPSPRPTPTSAPTPQATS